ncbi:hypothetical protein O3P69_017079 [Scylla paramamosain]|uniref:Uncharacterized protein n=1 Tax=Scylla paramamosain TaxID=85552 RepID=A0AAW0TTR3_SCYPA
MFGKVYILTRAELWVEKVRPVLARNWNFQLLKEPLWVFRWHHLCFTYDHRQHVISTYVDGRLNNEQQYEVGASFSGSRVVLGQGNGPKRSLSADLSQVSPQAKVKAKGSAMRAGRVGGEALALREWCSSNSRLSAAPN